jgi:hypothetical protein
MAEFFGAAQARAYRRARLADVEASAKNNGIEPVVDVRPEIPAPGGRSESDRGGGAANVDTVLRQRR